MFKSFFALDFQNCNHCLIAMSESGNGSRNETFGKGHPRKTGHDRFPQKTTGRHQTHQFRNVQKTSGLYFCFEVC